jgi:hypothetical protein
MNTKYTPEPWEWSKSEFNGPVIDRLLQDECGIYPPLGEAGPVAIASGEANAARIVACVNAMAGIDDPEQWVAMAKTHIDASEYQSAQNRRLQEERDELLAALKELVLDRYAGIADYLHLAECKNLIAKIESR